MRTLLSIVAAALIAAAAVPAHAAGEVTVGFGLSAGTYAPTGAACQLDVPSGADGVAVLDAAMVAGCIRSYEVEETSFGRFVSCINGICGPLEEVVYATYWGMYENGAMTAYGVDGFTAEAGDELVFAYTTWVSCLTPVGCI